MSAHFGLDISPSSIKLIEAVKSGQKYRLKAFGECPTPGNINSDMVQDQAAIAQAIKKLAHDARAEGEEVVVALSESQIYSKVIQFPILGSAELESALKFEAEQYVPVPLDEVIIQHVVLKMPPKGAELAKMEVLLVAAQQKAVERMDKIVTMADFTPIAMETELLAALRAVSSQIQGSGILIDLGKNSTDLAVVIDGSLKQVNTIASGGETLTRSVAALLSLQASQAEQYKRNYGLDKTQLEGKVAQAILDPLSKIVSQIRNSLAFARQKTPDAQIEKAILIGGTALMPDLSSYLADQLGVEVLLGDPFYNFVKDDSFPEVLLQVASRFATAVGLAIRE